MRDWFLQRGIFDFENKKKKLDQLNLEINKKGFWDNTQYAQKVSIEASTIEKLITSLSSLENDLIELKELIELTEEENINEKDYQDEINKLEIKLNNTDKYDIKPKIHYEFDSLSKNKERYELFIKTNS